MEVAEFPEAALPFLMSAARADVRSLPLAECAPHHVQKTHGLPGSRLREVSFFSVRPPRPSAETLGA